MATVTGTSADDFIHRAGDGRTGGGHEVTGVTTGADTISGAEGNDLVFGDDGNDSISGGSGNDVLVGGQGADSLNGGVGYDTFRIEAVSEISGLAETIDGGADVDRLDFATANAFGAVDLSHATITNVEELDFAGSGNAFTLTAGQLGAFTTLAGNFGVDTLIVSSAGTVDLTGAVISSIEEIRGSAGNDSFILTGVANGQTVNGVGGNDTISGGSGNDTLNGGDGTDTIHGDTGNDTLVGGTGVDTLTGDDGNDVIRGGQGADILTGGVGTDAFAFEQASDISGLAEQIDGGADADRLDFGSFNASGAVDLSAATIANVEELDFAGSGNTITLTAAQLGAFTTLAGNFGVDTLILSAAGTADLTGAAISSVEEIRGSAGNDVITLTGVANGQVVNGVAGNDTISGGNGNDSLSGGDGIDTLNGGNGNDTIDGGQGADTLSGGVGTDDFTFHQLSEISGLAEHIDGGADNDRLDFAAFNATGAVYLSLATIANVEELDFAGGGNTVTLTAAQLGAFSILAGNFGVDTLILSAPGTADLTGATISSVEEIRGSAGNDVITLAGVVNGQTVNGVGGDDTLVGGNGADVLNGGAGKDTLIGGGGADLFVVAALSDSVVGANADRITDFNLAQDDRIDVSRIDANTAVAGDQAFTFIGAGAYTHHAGELHYAFSGSDTVVAGDVNGDGASDFYILLTGHIAPVAGDFVL